MPSKYSTAFPWSQWWSMPKTPAMKNPTPSRLYQAIGVVEIEAVLWICYLQVHSLGIWVVSGRKALGAQKFFPFFLFKKTQDFLIARPGAKTMWFFIFFWGFYTPDLWQLKPLKNKPNPTRERMVFSNHPIFQVARLLNFESGHLSKRPEKFGKSCTTINI